MRRRVLFRYGISDVMETLIHNFFNLEVMYKSRYLLWLGFKVTLQLSFVSLVFAALLGLFLAFLRSIKNRVVTGLIIVYVDLFRALPTIVLFMLVYFGFALNRFLSVPPGWTVPFSPSNRGILGPCRSTSIRPTL